MTEREQMSGSHECGGDAAAYVLGALEGQELEAFRTHLEQCAVCRDEVDAFGGVVNVLPIAAPQQRASRSLRRRVMREVRQEPRRAPHPARPARSLPTLGGACLGGHGYGVRSRGRGGRRRLESGRRGRSDRLSRACKRDRRDSRPGADERSRGACGAPPNASGTPPRIRGLAAARQRRARAGQRPLRRELHGDADIGLPTKLHGVTRVLVTSEPLGGSNAPTHAPVIVARLD